MPASSAGSCPPRNEAEALDLEADATVQALQALPPIVSQAPIAGVDLAGAFQQLPMLLQLLVVLPQHRCAGKGGPGHILVLASLVQVLSEHVLRHHEALLQAGIKSTWENCSMACLAMSQITACDLMIRQAFSRQQAGAGCCSIPWLLDSRCPAQLRSCCLCAGSQDPAAGKEPLH